MDGTFPIESILLAASVLVFLSILASKASQKLGVPALLLFLAIGMLAGSDGPGGIEFDYPRAAQYGGVIALIFILFSGGLDTDWREVRPVLWSGLSLATVGVFLTALLVGWFAFVVLNFSWLDSLVLGAVVSCTDAAAVFAVLRAKKISLRGHLKPLLELESGSNDAMAVLLTVGLLRLVTNPETTMTDLVLMFVMQMAIGTAAGLAMGRAMAYLMNAIRLDYEGLYPVLSVSLVFFTYAATAEVGGNGFLAAYIAGLVLGHHEFHAKKELLRFHDVIAWLMQIIMFLTLGLQVFPFRLLPIIGIGLLISGFLMFLARPIAVFISLLTSRLTLRETVFISWVGLRGAVPIILATFPLVAGNPQADMIFHLVFFIVLTSVLLQGTTLSTVARWLKVGGTGET
jgi:cell volume regulation protein A